MGTKKNNTVYILIAVLSLLVFYQYTIINTIKTQNNELNSRISTLEQKPETESYTEQIDELYQEINKLNQKITQIETELQIPIEETPTIETRIPVEWVNQTTLSNLDLSNITLKDPHNKYHVTSDTLTWNKINRTHNQGLVATQFNLTHHIVEFDFQLDNFTFGDGGNRRLITLWAISDTEEVNDTRSYTMLYAEQVTYREGIYELIFHQKQNNENMFVDVGIIFQLNTSYHCRIIRYGDYAKYQVYTNSSKTEQLYDSGEKFLVDDDYRYLYFGYMYPPSKRNDLHITSSGKISYINILDSNN